MKNHDGEIEILDTVFKSGWPCHNKFEDLPPEFLKTEQKEEERTSKKKRS